MKKEDVNGCFHNMILIDKSELNSIFGVNAKNQFEKDRIINIILDRIKDKKQLINDFNFIGAQDCKAYEYAKEILIELEYIMKKIKEGI